MKKVIQIACHV